MRPAIWSGGRPVYCQTTPITGIRMSGKISVGVRSAARGPRIASSNASTTNVYGRLRAIRTIAVIEQVFLYQSRGTRGNSRADLPEMRQNGQPGRPPRLQFRETGPKVKPARLSQAKLRSAHQFECVSEE